MSSYRRFVTYLFQYQNGIKGKNCGFSKVEIRGNDGRIQIQVKGITDADYEVYLFVQEEEEIAGIRIGGLTVRGQSGAIVLPVHSDAVGGTSRNIDEIRGIYLSAGTEVFIASQWGDEEISWEHFRVYTETDRAEDAKTVCSDEAEEQSIAGENTIQASDRIVQPDNKCVQLRDGSEKEFEKNAVTQDNNLSKAVIPQMQATQTAAARQPVSYPNVWEQQWQNFLAKHPSFAPFDAEPDILAVKMDLRDLRILPKRYQSLVNNSFLLHGYFNYKYILFGCEEGENRRWFIGVPGSFQNQEQLLAGLFGFPEFRTKHQTKQKTGEFGYWYRYLEI